MDTITYQQLAELIYNYCGIDYRKNLSSLESKIMGRLNELELSCWGYTGYLRMEPKEWDTLIELITVNETFFYREENLLEEFQKVLLPQYGNCSRSNPLRIWSCACSTGEEPYTIAMLIADTGLFQEGSVQIIATDINKKVLKKAQEGRYHKKSFSFRKMPFGAFEKFFVDEGEYYCVKEEIRNMVDFRNMNLMDKNIVGKIEKSDIILCRNVLIYFDLKVIQTIINNFYDILKPNGYLLLGHSETLTFLQHNFKTIDTQHLFYYRKGDNPI